MSGTIEERLAALERQQNEFDEGGRLFFREIREQIDDLTAECHSVVKRLNDFLEKARKRIRL